VELVEYLQTVQVVCKVHKAIQEHQVLLVQAELVEPVALQVLQVLLVQAV